MYGYVCYRDWPGDGRVYFAWVSQRRDPDLPRRIEAPPAVKRVMTWQIFTHSLLVLRALVIILHCGTTALFDLTPGYQPSFIDIIINAVFQSTIPLFILVSSFSLSLFFSRTPELF